MATGGAPCLLALGNISKDFGPTRAVDNVSLDIHAGEIHALVGENGAGKSTLGKLMTGVHSPDAGHIRVDGAPVRLSGPSDALRRGLVGIAQELSLMATRSVADNIMLGREITRGPVVSERRNRAAALKIMESCGMALDPDRIVGTLPVFDRQKVEIARALGRDARLIVLDEPTARLPPAATRHLHATVRRLAQAGKAIVYVSHFLEEVLALADKVTILRNGCLIRSAAARTESRKSLIEGMTGRTAEAQFPKIARPDAAAPVVLSVENLAVHGADAPVSFTIRAGEILGLSGLVGAGRSEIAHALIGSEPATGHIFLNGQDLSLAPIEARLRAGFAFVPESRRDQGLMMMRSIRENVSLPWLDRLSAWTGLNLAREARETARHCAVATVKFGALADPVATLSGGNQQKVLFARAGLGSPQVLIIDEPTRGVDVGAKRKIYDLIASMAARGTAILLVSSEIEEIIGLCHRVLVIAQGHVAGEFCDAAITREALMSAAFSKV